MKYQFKPQNRDELYAIIKEIIINQKNNPDYKFGLKDVDVSLINDMSYLFSCFKYDKNSEINRKIDWNDYRNDITKWKTSNVTDMKFMFKNSFFNQNISHWDVSQVTNMDHMFEQSDFNQLIVDWNVSSVTNMSFMFANSLFNQNISNWDVSNVIDMEAMFMYSSFNHNLYRWMNRLNQQVDLQFFNDNSEHEKIFGFIESIYDFIKKQLTPQIWLNEYKESNDREQFELLKLLKHRDKKFIETLNQLLKKENVTIDI